MTRGPNELFLTLAIPWCCYKTSRAFDGFLTSIIWQKYHPLELKHQPIFPLVLEPNTNDARLSFLSHLLRLRWGWVSFKSRLQNDVRRFGRGLAGLFSQQILLNLIKRFSIQHKIPGMKRTCDVSKVFSQIESLQAAVCVPLVSGNRSGNAYETCRFPLIPVPFSFQ